MMRIVRWGAYALLAAILAGWAVAWLRPALFSDIVGAVTGRLTASGGVTVGGPFTLVDTAGRTVTDKTYRGEWMLVYFGYTFCPDVCPTELQTIANALDALGPDAGKLAPLFITIDPARDTVPVMADYVKLFHPRLVGLTGTEAQIADAARAYRVYYAKVTPKDSSTYLMDHSSFIYLMGPDGRFRGLFHPGVTAEELAKGIRARMAAG
jgi:protein SCO1/2